MDITTQVAEITQVFTDRFDSVELYFLLLISLFLLMFISIRLCIFAWTIVSATFALLYYVPLDLLPDWVVPAKEFVLQAPDLFLVKLIEHLGA